MSKKIEIDGVETEVFMADEVSAQVGAKEKELTEVWGKEKTELTGKLTAAEEANAKRAREFAEARGKFKELSDEQYAKLDEVNRTLYDNQKLLADKDVQLGEADKKVYDSSIDAAIRAKVGNDQKIIDKVKEMYAMIGIDDVTPEGMQQRVNAAVGAVSQTTPDLVAGLHRVGGTFAPPVVEQKKESFADTERGKAGAKFLGLEPEEKKK